MLPIYAWPRSSLITQSKICKIYDYRCLTSILRIGNAGKLGRGFAAGILLGQSYAAIDRHHANAPGFAHDAHFGSSWLIPSEEALLLQQYRWW